MDEGKCNTERLSNSYKSHSKKVIELRLPPSPKPSMYSGRWVWHWSGKCPANRKVNKCIFGVAL